MSNRQALYEAAKAYKSISTLVAQLDAQGAFEKAGIEDEPRASAIQEAISDASAALRSVSRLIEGALEDDLCGLEVESPAIEVAEAALDGEAWAVRIIEKSQPVSRERAQELMRTKYDVPTS